MMEKDHDCPCFKKKRNVTNCLDALYSCYDEGYPSGGIDCRNEHHAPKE